MFDINTSSYNYSKKTPLILAVDNTKNIKIIKLLLKAGANTEALDKKNRTSLQIAYDNNDTKIMQILISAGAKIDLLDGARNSLLTRAVKDGNSQVTLLLIKADANLLSENIHGHAAYEYGGYLDNKKVAELLVTLSFQERKNRLAK